MENRLVQDGALDWLAAATGSNVAYRGGVSVVAEDADIADPAPKVLSYVNGYAETNPDVRNNYVDLTPAPNGVSPFAYFMDGSRQAW